MIRQGERILRAVAIGAVPQTERLLNARWVQDRIASGSLPATRWVAENPAVGFDSSQFRWLEHARLSFPCYPHEITASQLHEAARLTLTLAQEALEDGWVLKDASAWNVLFDRGRPVFCDVLSFDPLGDSGLWPAYAQFQRHFVIPLLLHRQLGIRPSSVFLSRREGIDPEDARPMLKGWIAWRQPALEAVTLPALMRRRARTLPAPAMKPAAGAALSRFLLARTFRRLHNHLARLTPHGSAAASKWADYASQRDHYSPADLDAKREFVRACLAVAQHKTVLDLGCNTGEFSLLAASLGKQVVAADFDEPSLEKLYAVLLRERADIQPLILDIGRPTPAVGWMNSEVPAVLARITGRFDCVLMLGLIHHLLVSERATLAQIAELLHSLQAPTVIVEWIEREDRRFREIAGINAHLYEGLDRERFEEAITAHFAIERSVQLPGGTRTLYECRRR